MTPFAERELAIIRSDKPLATKLELIVDNIIDEVQANPHPDCLPIVQATILLGFAFDELALHRLLTVDGRKRVEPIARDYLIVKWSDRNV